MAGVFQRKAIGYIYLGSRSFFDVALQKFTICILELYFNLAELYHYI